MHRPCFILSLILLVSSCPAFTNPLDSPLARTSDPIGSQLQGTFISAPPETAAKAEASFIAYRKSFILSVAPRSARLHIFGDARYILWVNGQPVHRGPNRFETRGPEYDTVEIATALRAGKNQMAVVLMGYAGRGNNARMMSHTPGLTLRLDADGRTILKTDETWKWSDQTRYRSAKVDWAKVTDLVDTRVEDGDWTLPEYNDAAWKPAVKVSGELGSIVRAPYAAPARHASGNQVCRERNLSHHAGCWPKGSFSHGQASASLHSSHAGSGGGDRT